MDSVQIISAYLHNRQNCQTATVYQYNMGMVLKIIGPTLPTAYEVDFANSVTGQSITQIGNSEGVTIPDQFFTPGSMIHAWVVLVGEDYVVTRYHIMIPISPRAVRTSEEPTPSQQGAIDQAIAALNDGVERAEAAADEAEQTVADVQETIDTALEEAKASGEFDGPPGPGVAPGGSTGQVLAKKSSADYDTEWVEPTEGGVTDVQVNGTSVVQGGVANVPVMGSSSGQPGVLGYSPNMANTGLQRVDGNVPYLKLFSAPDNLIKLANDSYILPVIIAKQHVSVFYGLARAAGDSTQPQSSNPVGTYTDEAKAAIQQMLDVPSTDDIPTVPVQDVQVNSASVLTDGVANVPLAADRGATGVVKINRSFGITETAGILTFQPTSVDDAKGGASALRAVQPSIQHASAFYGLAKAAGSDEKNSTLPVGQYTNAAKSAISTMLNGPVSVSGSTPTITALPGIQYICGEVTTLDITLPASGCVDVVFTSGSTPTMLTVTPPTGVTVKWANGFDPTSLEANTTYEINIKDGLGVAGSWT